MRANAPLDQAIEDLFVPAQYEVKSDYPRILNVGCARTTLIGLTTVLKYRTTPSE